MSCCIPNDDEVQTLQKKYSDNSSNQSSQSVKVKLPRGGWLVETSEGIIQYSMVPETVKDCLSKGIKVPQYYIVPLRKFDKKFCINVCEFEFPAYYSFFLNKKKVNLICTPQEEKQIRNVFQETLLGPLDFLDFEDDFDSRYDKELIPDIKKELAVFRGGLSIDMLLSFTHLLPDENNVLVAKIGEVQIHRSKTQVKIYDKGELLTQGKSRVKVGLTDDQQKDIQEFGIFFNPKVQSASQEIQDHPILYKENPIISDFVPPQFGLTVLGSSHGFDASGNTSGYILWIGGRGILVDPPPFSTFKLIKMGIPTYYIKGIILSHTHADHDAGVFQQLMEAQKIEIITTKTIMNSFLRKYSSITQMSISQLKKFFKFRPATIGNECKVNGGSIEFFYALHSIPCIGFICRYQGKSIYFSGDTYYYPEKMKESYLDAGNMSQKRFEYLTNFDNKFKHDLILHEMGVAPIHTPATVLASLPSEIKDKIVIVHSSKNNIPQTSGLHAAKEGIENTYILYDSEFQKTDSTIVLLKKIDLISSFPLFNGAPLSVIRNVLECIQEISYKQGEQIVKEGDYGDELFMIYEGFVKIFSNSEGKLFERYFSIGNFFGEAALYTGQKRNADVVASTNCKLLVLKRNDFMFIFEGTQAITNLKNLYTSRVQLSLGGVQKNSMLCNLNSSQQIEIESILKQVSFKQDEFIWKEDEKIDFVFLLNKGKVKFSKSQREDIELQEGSLFAETFLMIFNQNHSSNIKTLTDCEGFIIEKQKWISFLESNPGFYHFVVDNLIIQ